MRRMNGGIIGPRITTTTSGAPGIWGTGEFYNKMITNLWPTFRFYNTTVSYDFTSNNATATFDGVTISGLAAPSSTGGLYTITNDNGYAGGVQGGNGGPGYAAYGYDHGGPGGSIGNADGGGSGQVYNSNDISGLWAAVNLAGGTGDGSFGRGGYGTVGGDAGDGSFAGGGGGSLWGSTYLAGTGGNAAIVIRYKYWIYDIATIINQSSGAGSFTFPNGTYYVKIWAIGRGRNGSRSSSTRYPGGGAGGAAYCEFYNYPP